MKWSDKAIQAYLTLVAIASLVVAVAAGMKWGG